MTNIPGELYRKMYQIRMRSSYTHIVYNVVLLVGLESKLSYYDNRRQYNILQEWYHSSDSFGILLESPSIRTLCVC